MTATTAVTSAQQLVGTYTGSWDFFALDASGNVVKTFSARDTATAQAPKLAGDRAFVTVRDVMQMPGREMALDFTEGYFVKPDGSAGDRFFEMYDRTVVEQPIGDRAWAFQTPVTHTTLKTESLADGVETQHVTRLTTVHWRDGEHIRSVQFVSMSGTHTRAPT